MFSIPAVYGQTFTVTASPSTLTIYPGQQNVPLAVAIGSSSYAGPINVTLSGLPSGISVSPITLTAGSSGTLKLSASAAAGNEGFYQGRNSSWRAAITVVAASGATRVTLPLALTVTVSNPSFVPDASAINLPIVRIDTNGTPIVDKVTDVPGTINITSSDGQTSFLPSSGNADNTATFHVHGNSTALMPKLPYKIKLNSSADLLAAMGVTCPYVTNKGKPICDKSKSYVLLANYDDKTLLRDWAASALANAIPLGNGYLDSPSGSPSPSGNSTRMPWAPHSLFVELYLNGVYEGNYQLIEAVKIDSHRVNISELSETDITGDITGGYLLEVDQGQKEDVYFTTKAGMRIAFEDPDFSPDPQVPAQVEYISSYVDAAETALNSSNFTDPTTGWRAYFDEASVVNFYIVNDLMGNNDGGALWSSDYFYKAADNPLFYMGPVWDFDISSGNNSMNVISNPTVPWMQVASWYTQFFNDPAFKANVVNQWNALKKNGVFSAWIASIQTQAKGLEKSQANNFGRWPMLGIEVWPNSEAVGTYDGEVQYLTNWLNLRLAYLDGLFNNRAQTSIALGIGSEALRSGSPVELTARVMGGTNPAGAVSFLSNNVLLGTGLLAGDTASITTSNMPAGPNHLQAVYSGDANNALSASTLQVVTVDAALNSIMLSVSGPATTSYGSPAVFTASVTPNSGSTMPTGSISFAVDGRASATVTVDGSALASFSTSELTAGDHTVFATYSGDKYYSPASSAGGNGALTVTPVPSSFMLTADHVALTPGQSVTLTATAGTVGGRPPTGTISFLDNGIQFGAATLSAGASSFTTATLLPGATHTVTAEYRGDSNFTGESFGALTVTVAPLDFTMAIVGPSAGTTTAGRSFTYLFTTAPVYGSYPGTVSFAVSGLPDGYVARFSPETIPAAGGAQTVAVSVYRPLVGILQPRPGIGNFRPMSLAILLLPLLGVGPVRRRGLRWNKMSLLIVLLAGLAGAAAIPGCGSSEQTAQNYNVTVTASGGSMQHSIGLTLQTK
jgi:hypothetical protein